MTKPRISTAKGAGRTPAQTALRMKKAFKAAFSTEDGEIVLTELLARVGYFRPPSLAEWMERTGSPQGFELHCALQAARCEPLRAILNEIETSDETMIALERAAREARS